MAQVREAFAGVEDADPQAGEELQPRTPRVETSGAAQTWLRPRTEARRVAGILARATAEILGKSQ